ncbi:pimeloyl-ACP methyl ester carboxylesterase [Phenylobacterium haematophilum]|uniref:Pimeloyl-ACP methyl ester carboxylesterase n=1 Tax=Phenylobacterium haematophilum TaxID=98513 RepID=A0A839ZW91_9CAUL|nr:alpha/beta hydrolase [Phenylobacterium haematophilum]MBB3890566.1 pimeloyl-ACP methyl ester carboxylesterase [Phenylobacterium haematophilum]
MFKALTTCLAGVLFAVFATSPVAAEVFRLEGAPGEPALLVRHEPGPGQSVLLVHGATFPSALSFAYSIDGRSWMDDLRSRGFDVWAFDFAGFGESERTAAMLAEGQAISIPGRAPDGARQIERVVRRMRQTTGHERVLIVAHSWGTLPAGLFAGQRPELVERLVLFGPVARREGEAGAAPRRGSTLVTADDQRRSFAAGLPGGQSPLIAPTLFDRWVEAYLATDPQSRDRMPPAVRVPSGPQADIADAWASSFPYNPATVRAPTLIVRGEWDNITRDSDVAWLVESLASVPGRARDVKLPRGGHRMHLEENRQALFDVVGAFLSQSPIGTAR